MTCSHVSIGGHSMIVCGKTRIHACSACKEPAVAMCDWKTGAGRTCDAPLCSQHTTKPSARKDLCPGHAERWQNHPANRQGSLDIGTV